MGDYSGTLASAALARYDEAAGSTEPNLQLLVAADNGVLLRANFTGGETSPATNTSRFAGADASAGAGASTGASAGASGRGESEGARGNVSFVATGVGEANLVMALRFVPAQLLRFALFRGLFLERVVQVR